MTPPSPSSRTTPSVPYLRDGYRVLVNNALRSGLEFFEEEVQPPGIVGQDEMETTSQFNTLWQTYTFQHLVRLQAYTMKGKYNPVLYTYFPTIAQRNTTITIHLPNGGSLAHYGGYKSLEFEHLVRGTKPTGTITVVPTMEDPATCVEEGPVYTAPTGTANPC